MSDQFAEQYKILQRAKKLEQMGSYDKALELYLDIHENYSPNTSDAFERPAILLERAKRYDEALVICNNAIKLIEDDKISGTKDKFIRRIEAIEAKLKESPSVKVDTKSGYHFGVVGFRSKNKIKKITSIIFYILFGVCGILMKSVFVPLALVGLVYTVTYFADSIQAKTTKKNKSIIVLLLVISISITSFSFMQIPEAFTRTFDLESTEEDSSLKDGSEIFDSEDDLPFITESNIADAIKTVKINIEVKDALIQVSGSNIAFGLLLDPTTSEDTAIKISEDFVNALSHLVANDEGIKRPSGKSHGELYNFYNFIISAGSDENNIIIKGKKSISSKYITWIE